MDIKKELSKYSKDEIIEAISSVVLSGFTLDMILSNAKKIKFNNLQKKSDEAFKNMISIKISVDMPPKKSLDLIRKRELFFKQYKKCEREINKLLDIKS